MAGLLADLGLDDLHKLPLTAQNFKSLDTTPIGTGSYGHKQKAKPRV